MTSASIAHRRRHIGATSRPARRTWRRALAPVAALASIAALALGFSANGALAAPATNDTAGGDGATPEASISAYYDAFEALGLLDVETGSRDSLKRDLGAAETMLKRGATIDAAVALYAIVESPRYLAFEDFVEYQNAEYDLAIALAGAGAYESAQVYLVRALERGPESIYFEAAHRRAVDLALETRDYGGILAALEQATAEVALPAEAAGEQTYLRARVAYVSGDLDAAAEALATLTPGSRLYSSSVYLRGVIRTRQGRLAEAADALCEVAVLPDDDPMAFVVDDRYYTIKDLARLGLGRIAHEQAEYDDAYYHYFQIPDDSDRLPEALFEAAWSMYQKRDLDAARDLLDELFASFPSAPQVPEARLLAGYIELADCRFDDALAYYERVIAELAPIVASVEALRANPERRRRLFERALDRRRAERADPNRSLAALPAAPTDTAPAGDEADGVPAPAGDATLDQVLALLQLDPKFVRLYEASRGLRRAAAAAPYGVRLWTSLGRQLSAERVRAVAAETSLEAADADDANALTDDVRRLRADVARAQRELTRATQAGTVPEAEAREERRRLTALAKSVDALATRTRRAAAALDSELEAATAPSLRAMIGADVARARTLQRSAERLQASLQRAADELAEDAIERLYRDLRRVLDKAKLGKIDAVIGQKRSLDIEVQNLAAGRYPAELKGRLWEEGLIGDDEEFWPFEGEFWEDEYQGFR